MIRRILAVTALLVLLVPTVAAHAVPFESSPRSGQRLDVAPQEVIVRFTEPVYDEGSFIQVRDSADRRVDLDDLRIERGDSPSTPTMRISLASSLPDGAYRILWQTYSRTDGHVVGGTIGFAVGGFEPPGTTGNDGGGLDPAAAAARGLLFAGFALALGGLVFTRSIGPASGTGSQDRWQHLGRRALLGATALGTLGIVGLLLDTWAGTGSGLAAFLSSTGGRVLLQRVLLAGALLVLSLLWLSRARTTLWQWRVLGVLWLAAVAYSARFGHASISGAGWTIVDFVHAVATTVWVGSLVLMVWVLWGRGGINLDVAGVHRLGSRFGRVALAAVVVMVVSGLALTITIVQASGAGLQTLLTSAWGRALAAKVLLAAAMVAIAGVNRWAFLATPPGPHAAGGLRGRLARHAIVGRGESGPFRRAAAAEAGMGVMVLVLAGLLTSVGTPQPGLADAPAFEAGAQGDDVLGLFQIQDVPAAGGSYDVRVFLQYEADEGPIRDNDCAPGRDDCIRLDWYPDAAGPNASQEAVAVPDGDGWWTVPDVLFATGGPHTLELQVQTATVFRDVLVVSLDVADGPA